MRGTGLLGLIATLLLAVLIWHTVATATGLPEPRVVGVIGAAVDRAIERVVADIPTVLG